MLLGVDMSACVVNSDTEVTNFLAKYSICPLCGGARVIKIPKCSTTNGGFAILSRYVEAWCGYCGGAGYVYKDFIK